MKEYLKALDILTNKEIGQLWSLTKHRRLEKGEYFIREKQVCREVVFVEKGILRSYYTDSEGEEITYCITFSKRFMTAYSSLITGSPTPENIQAVTDAKLRVIQKKEFEKLENESANWIRLQKFFAEQEYLAMEERVFSYQKTDARQRYQKLVKEHPDYLQEIPLQYLASYLGITPRHLSRIRSEVVL
ncbi:Crp/Fnr family transcriptional regulator [Gracilimonas mengyeensis]|uniref:cAMP-binding domain of CRP or a regulatory subunit of cAMP-dependent protein kinases n=1 Tax=Gracilimonas mengyeensis TaxID=1302730 RepID=A0A521C129_9BACT|nr:Crp/Fnr family transcriptional regulator [Gracilimonas mengyeensis]SMO53103.1 cAMP-binding domain of CRP or a regulatory subunit of cAMP-dependent protein kinases [Gracilimonas mengyeensis]